MTERKQPYEPSVTHERLKYVTTRQNRAGSLRYYWQRKGSPLVRLPDDPVKRLEMVQRLNDQVDAARPPDPTVEGTLAWLIARYREEERFQALAPKTRSIYERWLEELGRMWGHLPPSSISRRVAIHYAQGIDSPATRLQAVAVLRNVMELACYYDPRQINPAKGLRLTAPKARQSRWDWPDIAKILAACDEPAVDLALRILLYTAQRPVDVIGMRWDAYTTETIRLRQQKTGKLVEVPCHRDLRPALEAAKAARRGVYIVSREDGRPVSGAWLWKKIRALREACGLEHLQARDLRRTAMCLMAEAGATDVEIVAVSGHSIEQTRRILDTYIPRSVEMARGAIRKWEEKRTESNALDS
jgi:integrase